MYCAYLIRCIVRIFSIPDAISTLEYWILLRINSRYRRLCFCVRHTYISIDKKQCNRYLVPTFFAQAMIDDEYPFNWPPIVLVLVYSVKKMECCNLLSYRAPQKLVMKALAKKYKK